MSAQILTPDGSMQSPHNLSAVDIHLLSTRRASLIQQAEALKTQRRAILAEVGEIEKILRVEEPADKMSAKSLIGQ